MFWNSSEWGKGLKKAQFGFLWPHKEGFQTMKIIDYMLQLSDQRHGIIKFPHIESGIK